MGNNTNEGELMNLDKNNDEAMLTAMRALKKQVEEPVKSWKLVSNGINDTHLYDHSGNDLSAKLYITKLTFSAEVGKLPTVELHCTVLDGNVELVAEQLGVNVNDLHITEVEE